MAGSFGDWFGTLKNTFKVGKSTLSASGVATARTHTLPDAAGTVALTSDTYGGAVLRGHISGLLLANNGADANNDIDISVGEATDSTATYLLKLTSAITKRLDAAWAAGTNQGGIDTGSEAASTWYHVWLIRKDSDGSADVLFSTSVSSPTMPSGYTAKRLIGSVYNDASSALQAFVCAETANGIVVQWSTPVLDINLANTLTTTAQLNTLSVPVGYKVKAFFNVGQQDTVSGNNTYISDPDTSDVAPSASVAPLHTLYGSTSVIVAYRRECWTNSSGQIRSRASTTIDSYKLATLGWEWGRR